MTVLAGRVRLLAEGFRGRASDALLNDVLSQIEFSEWGLAFETLAAQLHEERVAVTSSELVEFSAIAGELGISGEVSFLEELVSLEG